MSPVASRVCETTGCGAAIADNAGAPAQGLRTPFITGSRSEGDRGAMVHAATTVALTLKLDDLVAALAGMTMAHAMRSGTRRRRPARVFMRAMFPKRATVSEFDRRPDVPAPSGGLFFSYTSLNKPRPGSKEAILHVRAALASNYTVGWSFVAHAASRQSATRG